MLQSIVVVRGAGGMSEKYKIAIIFLLLTNIISVGFLYFYYSDNAQPAMSKEQLAELATLQAENEYLKESKEQLREEYVALLQEKGSTVQGAPGVTDLGNFYVYFVPAQSKGLEPYEELARQSGFDEYVSAFNAVFALPISEGVGVVFMECGVQNAYYDPESKSILFCYEMIELFTAMSAFYEDEKSRSEYLTANMFFALNHEIAHAMIDIYELPVLGKEEDAADQLATLIGSSKAEYNFHAALSYRILDSLGYDSPYYDEHPLNEQRYYNLLCWTYGSDPITHYDIVYEEYLPSSRAVGCQNEFEKLEESWDELLSPYRKT